MNFKAASKGQKFGSTVLFHYSCPAWTKLAQLSLALGSLLLSLWFAFLFFFFAFLISKEKLPVLLGGLMCKAVISKAAEHPLFLEALLLGFFNLWVELICISTSGEWEVLKHVHMVEPLEAKTCFVELKKKKKKVARATSNHP